MTLKLLVNRTFFEGRSCTNIPSEKEGDVVGRIYCGRVLKNTCRYPSPHIDSQCGRGALGVSEVRGIHLTLPPRMLMQSGYWE